MKMKSGEEDLVIEVVSSTFNEFVAPEYSDEGIAEFFKYANAQALAERSKSNHFTIIAKLNSKSIGIIEIRDYKHISMLFVLKHSQRMGVGKMLLQKAIALCLKNQSHVQKLTVNSSPNSVRAYEKMGFTPDNTEQCVNGIRFIPMSLSL